MNSLFLIPARGGSKGIPQKNIKMMCGRPLIAYTIDVAREIVPDSNICVSTDDAEIIKVVEGMELKVPFVRPTSLASDEATTNDVILHALEFYKSSGTIFDSVILLQVTSPLRTAEQVKEAMKLYSQDIDMVVGVRKSDVFPVLRQENENGFLKPVFDLKKGVRRQDAETLYEINGAIYVINPESIINKGMNGFTKIRKYVMPKISSIDIDDMIDWNICESIISKL